MAYKPQGYTPELDFDPLRLGWLVLIVNLREIVKITFGAIIL